MLRSGGKISVVEERGLSILRINNVTDSDTGAVKCLAKNTLAEIQREVQLELTGEQRAPVIVDKSKSADVNAGESVEFFVKVSGAPTPTGNARVVHELLSLSIEQIGGNQSLQNSYYTMIVCETFSRANQCATSR